MPSGDIGRFGSNGPDTSEIRQNHRISDAIDLFILEWREKSGSPLQAVWDMFPDQGEFAHMGTNRRIGDTTGEMEDN